MNVKEQRCITAAFMLMCLAVVILLWGMRHKPPTPPVLKPGQMYYYDKADGMLLVQPRTDTECVSYDVVREMFNPFNPDNCLPE